MAAPTRATNNFHALRLLDALRLLGAFLVLFSHQAALSGRVEPRVVAGHTYGNLGVLIFFSISGTLVSASWEHDPHVLRFAARRALRLVPGLVVACLIASIGVTLLVQAPGAGPRLASYLAHLPLGQLDAPLFFPGQKFTTLDASLWTIPFEAECYVVLCALGVLTARRLTGAVAIASVVALVGYVAFGMQRAVDHAFDVGTISFLAYFGAFFLAGSLLHFFPSLLRFTPAFIATGLVCIAARQSLLGLALMVPALAIYVGQRSWPVLRRAGDLGDVSYGIYIYAWPVGQLVVWKLGAAPYLVLVTWSVLITTLLAFASWHLVEKRALTLKPRRTEARPTLETG